jgi:transposase-like protein
MGEKKSESNGTGVNWEPPRGRRWCEEDARAGLAAARLSGKRLSRFAREHGFHVSRLYWWMKALNEKPARPAAFLPVRVVEKRARSEQREGGGRQDDLTLATVDVVVGNKRVVRVGRGFDPALLRAVIAALEIESC